MRNLIDSKISKDTGTKGSGGTPPDSTLTKTDLKMKISLDQEEVKDLYIHDIESPAMLSNEQQKKHK